MFKSRAGQIEHRVARHFFERSRVARWCNDANMLSLAPQTRYTLRRNAGSAMNYLIKLFLFNLFCFFVVCAICTLLLMLDEAVM